MVEKGIRERQYQDNAWFYPAHDAVHWRDLVNTAIKLLCKKWVNSGVEA